MEDIVKLMQRIEQDKETEPEMNKKKRVKIVRINEKPKKNVKKVKVIHGNKEIECDEDDLDEVFNLDESISRLEPMLQEYANLLRDDLEDLYGLLEAEQPQTGYKSGAESMPPAGHQWVYVFCVNAKLPTTRVIKHFTKQPYNHAALSFDKSLTNMVSFSIGAGNNGFVRENIHNVYKPDAEFSLYKIAVPNDALKVMKDAVNNVETFRDEYRYSFMGLLGFVFKKHQDKFNTREKAMFCSQFVARMFASAGMQIFNKQDYEIRPYDFARNKNFTFCYKGKVKNFNPARIR